jgi:AsmA protein
MKSFFKYGVVSLVTVVFLLIVTVLVLPVLINVQRFVPQVEKKISEVTGRSVSIGPDAGLSFFPWLSVSFSDIKLGNPQGFLSDIFLRMDSFEARIKLLPLLKKEVQISRLAIDGLEINLETREDGKVNWDFGWENHNQMPSSSSSQQGAW